MAQVVNLGSLCIDYVYAVPNIAGDGETVASISRDIFAGGKGLNQSIAAARAGSRVVHYGAVGADGQLLLDALEAAGVDHGSVVVADVPSGHAVIQVNTAGQNAIVIHGGANRTLTASYFAQAQNRLEPGDWLLLQNEINGLAEFLAGLPDRNQRAYKVAMNLAPADERIFSYPLEQLDLLIVNEVEACALAGVDNVASAQQSLNERLPEVDVVLTLGALGAMSYTAGAGWSEFGAYRVEAVDETAAGDAFVGYLLAALAAGQDIRSSIESASAAGALAVTVAGAAPSVPSADAVQAFLNTHGELPPARASA